MGAKTLGDANFLPRGMRREDAAANYSRWVEERARTTGKPQNRVIIDCLASLDYLEKFRDFGELIRAEMLKFEKTAKQ
jgi:hypothetical protein